MQEQRNLKGYRFVKGVVIKVKYVVLLWTCRMDEFREIRVYMTVMNENRFRGRLRVKWKDREDFICERIDRGIYRVDVETVVYGEDSA